MPETPRSIITDALYLIRKTGAEEPPEAFDMELGLRILNRMMNAFEESDNIDIDWPDPTNVSTELDEVSDGAFRGIVNCLAAELYPYHYKGDIPSGIVSLAIAGKENLRTLGLTISEMDFPNTLPLGEGAEGTDIATLHFFTESDT